ncbi:MAG: hypothetical protein HY298_02435 [Verrucomicrobia bacterium]|nr:hypothetical protein [Verrucomicrobiota bacterium]
MASFIHLADAKNKRLIERNGIKAGKRGVFSIPVTKDFSVTHQWARELKRTGVKSLICVQFRVPDDEVVSVGMYNGEKLSMTAAESVATVANHTGPMGLEVVFDRKILPKEIFRIYPAPRIVGWRYYPDAKGKKPFCHCRFCNRGEIRAQRLIREDD